MNTQQPKLSPMVYRLMLQHWQDNQLLNCIYRVQTGWSLMLGVNYPEDIVIAKKEFRIGKS